MISDHCYFCGRKIYLVRYRSTYRWMDNPKNPDSWGCHGTNPGYKIMSHATKELIDYGKHRSEQIQSVSTVKPSKPEAAEG